MTGAANHKSEKPESMRPLGTPQYQEHVERQGQAALEATLAYPITRIVFGLLVLCFAVALPVLIVDAVETYPVWKATAVAVGMSVVFLVMILEMGSVAILGRSRTPWFRALMRRYSRHRCK